MRRIDSPELLDCEECPAQDVRAALTVIGRINRWFGGVRTTQRMVERAAQAARATKLSMLEVAAGSGELPELVRKRMARRGIDLDITLLDRSRSHLTSSNGRISNSRLSNQHRKVPSVTADGLALPFADETFDLVGCSLFAHHLDPQQLLQFVREGLRVSRVALLINDLVRNPIHLALAFTAYPLMRNRVAWLDGLTSVRRAYLPEEIWNMLPPVFPPGASLQISRHYLFRMGVMVWKDKNI